MQAWARSRVCANRPLRPAGPPPMHHPLGNPARVRACCCYFCCCCRGGGMCGAGAWARTGVGRLFAFARARACASQAALSRKLVLQLRWRSAARTPCSCRILARYCIFARCCTLLRPIGTMLHSRHAEASSGNGVRGCVSQRARARARRRRESLQA